MINYQKNTSRRNIFYARLNFLVEFGNLFDNFWILKVKVNEISIYEGRENELWSSDKFI